MATKLIVLVAEPMVLLLNTKPLLAEIVITLFATKISPLASVTLPFPVQV